MKRTGSSFLAILCFLLIAGTLHAAEEESFRHPPDFASRVKNIKTIAMFRPDIKIFEITSGGVKEFRQDWGDESCAKFQAAFISEFRRFGYDIKILDPAQDNSAEFREFMFLYDDVVRSILRHAYDGPHLFPSKKSNFDYTVGPIDNFLEAAGADALLLIRGVDEISTTGRKAMQTLAILAGAAAGVVMTPNMGRTVVIMGLVDRSGDLLWFNIRGGSGGYNLKDPEGVSQLVSQSLERFQEKIR